MKNPFSIHLHSVQRHAYRSGVLSVALIMCSAVASSQTPTTKQVEFFENSIRPVLADNCYRCHGENAEKLKGGLNVTHRAGLLTGGDRGTALVPGDADNSLLFEAVSYDNEDLQMPPKAKLPDEALSNIRTWIEMGAPDPRDRPLAAVGLEDEVTWAAVREERRKWWSFQPITRPEVPEVTSADWARHPVDQFIMAKLDDAGLSPTQLADARTLIRRLTYVLTGLPPTLEEAERFVAAAADDRQAALEAAADRLLASVHFGERWARHWMDWIRYAESHGSEGDPRIPYAWRYRDYLIRALNEDVPFDQLVREHLAGDIISKPRINRELDLNESAIGVAQYRLVQHGYSPTDALDEQVRFTDNQIDVISKGFLGVTVSCARCHNHKFDPISQKDFYALYGVMASSRPAILTVDTQKRQDTNKVELAALKPKLRAALSKAWLKASDATAENLLHPKDAWQEAIAPKRKNKERDEEEEEERDGELLTDREGRSQRNRLDPLYVWRHLRNLEGSEFDRAWSSLDAEWQASEERVRVRKRSDYSERWDLTGDDAASWYGHGNGLTSEPSQAGEFHVLPEGERIVGNILPAGMYSHTLSDKHSAILTSPRFRVKSASVFVRVIGDGGAVARYVVQNYPHGGETYPITGLGDGRWRWQEWSAEYWEGDHLYIELTTAADQPGRARDNRERSWFGISEAMVVEEGQHPARDELAEFIAPLFEMSGAPANAADLAQRYAETLRECITDWRNASMNNAQARFLDYFVGAGLLPNEVEGVRGAEKLLAEYRGFEEEVPVPTRAPGVLEGNSFDQPLFTRGNHRQPSEPVPRRFLEAIDDTPYRTADAGRKALAESILDSENPLTARVIANRLWHHIFGSGIVATPDNFGQMGELPSHPELLDYLAMWVVDEGWSLKETIRFITTSRTFQLSTTASAKALGVDPTNRLLSHSNLRRLEGEAIRDTLLMVAGRMDRTLFGESVGGRTNRRSVYVRVIRNRLDPFLTAFDSPVPTSTMGRRSITNVPAQALAMMNGPFVFELAGALSERVLEEYPDGDAEERVARMFELALGRQPLPEEAAYARNFIEETSDSGLVGANAARVTAEIAKRQARIEELTSEEDERQRERLEREVERFENGAGNPDSWHELAHAIFSMKEFIYLM